ncbi:MAG: hypothetical protein H7X75_10435 [Burkholderiaceae bacterium]|nr:hypothetical protein [Burkholderiaceae bacterium]
MKSAVLALLMPWAMAAYAQAPVPSAPPGPPPLPAADSKAVKPTLAPAKPRRAIELSPAERQAIDARELKAVRPASVEDALQPTPEDAKIEREENDNTTRIEQLRTSNRISEVIVTPPRAAYSYSMTNREGKQPFGTTQMSPGLSVPNFFRFEFGRSTPSTSTPSVPPPVTLPASPAKPSN